ncbi:MAG: methyltransferase domain-containing protein [Rhodospirillales bacterium]|nr:methyltransferase domain-containing protein [Rhodospirillales bacterium]
MAPLFVRFVQVGNGQRILDVGCGTGSLSTALLSVGPAVQVVGVDPVPAYVSFAREAVTDPRAHFEQSAAEEMPFPDATFDAALALLVLQELVEPLRAIREMARVTRQSGRVAACQWDFHDGLLMQSIFWNAAERLAPQEVARRRTEDNVIKRAGLQELTELWECIGLRQVTTARLEVSMRFLSFDDYWRPFMAGATPTSAFAAKLNRETDNQLERTVRSLMPNVQADGSFILPARGLAVAGVKA